MEVIDMKNWNDLYESLVEKELLYKWVKLLWTSGIEKHRIYGAWIIWLEKWNEWSIQRLGLKLDYLYKKELW